MAWARWAVTRWQEFPVQRQPRPLVLVGPRVRVEGGFRTAQAKLAFHHGLFEWRVSVPGPVRAELLAGAQPVDRHERVVDPLPIILAALSTGEFATDRGRRQLPAWRLEIDGGLAPVWVLDPEIDPPEWLPAPGAGAPWPTGSPPIADPHESAELADDGVTMTLHFIGGAEQLERYPRAEVVESDHAVALVPVREQIGPEGVYRTAVGFGRAVVGVLERPLGARVLVNLAGNASEVQYGPRLDRTRLNPPAVDQSSSAK
jgi:hypothetical protein